MKHALITATLLTSTLSADPSECPLLNLEEMAQDFVLDEKQLYIPGHPNAFNPSIARFDEGLILSFDSYSGDHPAPDQTGLVFLDLDFNVISTALQNLIKHSHT